MTAAYPAGGTITAESSSGEHGGNNGSVYTGEQEESETKVVHEHRGVAETFFRLFEEYPQSRAFFGHLVSNKLCCITCFTDLDMINLAQLLEFW